jgi:hypothetical protein
VVFEQISFYFPFDHSDVRIKQFVSFRYRNKLKIKLQKQIGFMHVDITNLDTTLKFIIWAVALVSCQSAPCRGCQLIYNINSLDIRSQWVEPYKVEPRRVEPNRVVLDHTPSRPWSTRSHYSIYQLMFTPESSLAPNLSIIECSGQQRY